MLLNVVAGVYLRTALIVFIVLIGPRSLFAVDVQVPTAGNLAVTGQLSRQQGIPTVVFVSRDACPYCRTLRDKILRPMLSAGKFDQRALLVEVSLDREDPVTDFENRQLTARDFGEFYDAQITPTLLFLDPEGREIGKRIIGISNLELYGHYLQKSVDEALLALRSDSQQN